MQGFKNGVSLNNDIITEIDCTPISVQLGDGDKEWQLGQHRRVLSGNRGIPYGKSKLKTFQS